MSEISKVTAKGFEPIKRSVIDTYNAKGMKASGNFERELEIKEIENGAVLLSEPYGEQLEKGRGASSGGSGTDIPLKDRIKEWVRHKGITADDISEDSLVYLITRKIHREGWDRKGYGGTELISQSILDSMFDDVINEVMRLEIEKTSNNLINIFK